jgi:uncharacterized membrane protein YoaK (UPF0700 family)
MTSNVTRFTMDLEEMLNGREPVGVARARTRTKRIWPTLVGFTVGCALGAAGEAAIGHVVLVLPAGFALLPLAIAFMPVSR